MKLPSDCTFNEQDWNVLASFWHAVANSEEVTNDKPYSTTLLDQRIVVYRTSTGISAARDVCPHRGAQLSRGWLKDDQLICPFHGIHFNAEGKCTRIPAHPEQKIPPSLCLETYLVEERYGLIWVCMKPEPLAPIPDWSQLEDSNYINANVPDESWDTSAPRHAENFNDVAHVAWVHQGSFGELPPEVCEYTLEETDNGLTHYYHSMGSTTLFERHSTTIGDKEGELLPDTFFRYDFTFPFASGLLVQSPDGEKDNYIFDVISPVSSRKLRVFKRLARNYALDQPFDGAVKVEQNVNKEDKGVLVYIRPEEVPLDLSEEFHIPSDKWAIAYRKRLKGYGLGSEISGTK